MIRWNFRVECIIQYPYTSAAADETFFETKKESTMASKVKNTLEDICLEEFIDCGASSEFVNTWLFRIGSPSYLR